jgi:hypothetical protein
MNGNSRVRPVMGIVGIGLAMLCGCGGVYDSSVAGMVTLDSSPVPRGTVTFKPTSTGPSAYGQIQSDGSYSLRTGREEGLPPGEYLVTVVANEPAPMEQTASGGPPPPGKPITPAWYKRTETSGLTFKVEPGSNDINLELSSTPPSGWQDPAQRGRR